MNEDIKKRWQEALRSGDYKQGQNRLSTNGAFCCLGVLCDLAVKDGLATWDDYDSWGASQCRSPSVSGAFMPYTSSTSLPPPIVEWAGLDSYDPIVGGNKLSSWNDNKGASFEKIATLIDLL